MGSKPPTSPWVGYNLFRLIAIVLMIWALVAQFLCLTDDLQAYSDDKKASSPVIASGLKGGIVELARPLPEPDLSDLSGDVDDSPVTTPIHRTKRRVRTFVSIGGSHVESSKRIKRDDESATASSDEDVNEYWAGSEIPTQPGGILFVVLSRITIAMILMLLISAQSGFPEVWLHDHVSWLGPQSTPLFLGFCQHLVAIDSLRVYAKTTNLLPAWCLFGISGVNILIGIFLKLLGRRLPKKPPPPLYFSHSVRLAYWNSPPAFYRQLSHPPPSNPTSTDPSNLPESNSHTLGIDSDISSSDEEKAISRTTPQTIDNGGRMTTDQDVRKGGYPTFSGGNVGDVRRQVPLGIVEKGKHGDAIRFMRDDGGGAGMSMGVRNKVEARRSALTPIVVPGRNGTEQNKQVVQPRQLPVPSQVRPQSHLRSDNTIYLNAQSQLAIRPRPQARSRGNAPLTPIGEGEEPPTATKPLLSRDPSRKFSVEAASDLGPQFPMPPTRQSTVQAAARAKRESSAMTIVSSPSLDTASYSLPGSPLKHTKETKGITRHTSTLSTRSIKPQFDLLPPESATLPPPSPARAPESPRTPTSKPPKSPRPPKSLRPKSKSKPRSSLAPITRSPATLTHHTERVSQGVRFQMNRSNSDSSLSSLSTAGSSPAPGGVARSGFRIPGLGVVVNLPFGGGGAVTPGPSRMSVISDGDSDRRRSFDSISSVISEGKGVLDRPEMTARASSGVLISENADEKGGGGSRMGKSGGSRPRSQIILGGQYLDEVDKKRTRRHSSIDSH